MEWSKLSRTLDSNGRISNWVRLDGRVWNEISVGSGRLHRSRGLAGGLREVE